MWQPVNPRDLAHSIKAVNPKVCHTPSRLSVTPHGLVSQPPSKLRVTCGCNRFCLDTLYWGFTQGEDGVLNSHVSTCLSVQAPGDGNEEVKGFSEIVMSRDLMGSQLIFPLPFHRLYVHGCRRGSGSKFFCWLSHCLLHSLHIIPHGLDSVNVHT